MTATPPMLVWLAPQTGVPLDVVLVGAKPPSNQPQLTPLALSRSPMFGPLMDTVGPLWLEHPS